MKKKSIKLGIVADDFTGAADAGSFLSESGHKTLLLTDIPDNFDEQCDCVVVALKTRSVDPSEAIIQTKKAYDFFRKIGVNKVYFKYCSTFDSTKRGNIGPVLDFSLDYFNMRYTLICPSLPINHRTVKNGVIYVNGIKLEDTHMRNHPLNPMWDSYIPNLMLHQSKNICIVPGADINNEKTVMNDPSQKFYLVPDYENDNDAKSIVHKYGELKFLSGGSGILEHLLGKKDDKREKLKNTKKKTIIVSGSCSTMTKKQIDYYKKTGGLAIPIDAEKLLGGELDAYSIYQSFIRDENRSVLLYSNGSNNGESDLSTQNQFDTKAKLLEDTFASICEIAVKEGFERIVVAGGETSGAVTKKLNFDMFQISETVSPGIPVLKTPDNKLELILKSGNFGGVDFFLKSISI